ncbi:MAG TPA: glutamine--fructose-6-phosphate transaminase (isomerizing) [Polyangia bacterium]|jgi:glucosamine--fructose-6-phosphate aminotransferase (isomerizing)|nr:glutamine--fructose-6-phosphate transaminase (isomerizing) [Polyangia bacterium]
MCGIVGYVGGREALPFLLSGLKRLEYRGYDSAGVAVSGPLGLQVVRRQGKLSVLEGVVATEPPRGTLGIGHTRWATHGRPSEINAHPHTSGAVTVVHNGIIENHLALRAELESAGRRFSSETDTEIFAHLIDTALAAGAPSLPDAVREALARVEGTYALVVISDRDPERIVAAKNHSPLVIGLGATETFLASDVPALLDHTREVIYLEDGDVAEVMRGTANVTDRTGAPVNRPRRTIEWNAAQAEKAGHPHFMLKEIFEQPQAVTDTLRGRLSPETGDAMLDGIDLPIASFRRVVLLACGTSYYAGLVGKFLIEAAARIPCEVDLASEFRYRDPVVGPGDLVIAISQSGETADTLAAVKEAKSRGATVLSICNVVDSAIPRASHGTLYTHAGPEIGVASTKCFTAQLAALALIALHVGRRRATLTADAARAIAGDLATLPQKMASCLASLVPAAEAGAPLAKLAEKYRDARDFLFLGRGTNYPIALEGALKLKEISYIHAEGYAAGEMKHGPIALIDDGVPVVVVAPRGHGYEKVLSNLAEVRARKGRILAIATEGDELISSQCDDVLRIPDAAPLVQPFLTVLPLQLLAYAIAIAKGNDVDQPRNLAKSVTVE